MVLSPLRSLARYARPEDNVLAAGCQLTLVFCFIGGGYIWLFEHFSAQLSQLSSTESASNLMVFSSTTAIALPLVVVTLAMVALMLGIMVSLIREEGRHPILLLAKTCVPPFLTIGKTQKWHLFLSHVWKTAQE